MVDITKPRIVTVISLYKKISKLIFVIIIMSIFNILGLSLIVGNQQQMYKKISETHAIVLSQKAELICQDSTTTEDLINELMKDYENKSLFKDMIGNNK